MIRFHFLFLTLILCVQASAGFQQGEKIISGKILTITVNQDGVISLGRDTLPVTELAKELKSRLWRSYLGTDRMHDAINLQFSGNLSSDVRSAVIEAIHEGQKMALKDICVQKHKKLFEDLSSGQQEKIRKQFPVLFQTDYS